MNVGKAIYYLLSNATSVTDIAGTRIYPELAEQEAATPYAVYQIVSVNPDDTNDGPAVIDEVSIDVLCVADSYNEAADLATAVRAALDRVRGTYNGVNVESIQYDSTDSDVQDSPRRYEQTVTLTVRVFRDDAQIATGQNIDQLTLGRLYDVTDDATTGQVIIKQADGTWAGGDQGTGTGGVDSVNGETGAVTLTTDDISDSGQANKYTTAADITKLAGIEAGAQVNAVTSVNGATGAITGLATTTYVDSEVGAEESARITADNGLQTQINTVSGGVTTNAADIATNATAITTEASTRAAADTALQTEVDANTAAISAEATARANADTNLQNQVSSNDGDITALDGRLTTAEGEIDTLQAADYVNTLNGVDGAVTIAAGSNVTVSTAGQTITISSSGDGGGGSDSFNTIAVSGQTSVVADQGNDTLTLNAGANITLTTDPTNDAVTFAVSGLDTDDVTEAGNLYYTEARVTANASVVANTAKNSYPTADASKLAGIEAGAEVNVNADWSAASGDAQILNKPTLAAVATSGAYGDLSGTPTIPPQFFGVFTTAATSVTLDTGDEGRYIRCTASSAVTVTVPSNKFQADDEILIEQSGTGQVEVQAGTGVTINTSSANTKKTAERYAVVALKCTATNVFTLTGERELA